MNPLLPDDYYWTNFLLMVQYSFSRYKNFFTEAEQTQIQQFLKLPKNSQCLFIRLFNRKGNVFRQEKLNYPEITNLHESIENLKQYRFLHTNSVDIAPNELLEELTLSELQILARPLFSKISRPSKKKDICSFLKTEWNSISPHLSKYAWICLLERPLLQRLMVLFFCNRYQSMAEFVLVDLGKVRYERYFIHPEHFFFPNRLALEKYLDWGEQRDRFLEALESLENIHLQEQIHKFFQYPEEEILENRALYEMIFFAIRAYENSKNWPFIINCYERLLNLRFHFETSVRYLQCLEKSHRFVKAREQAYFFFEQRLATEEKLFFQFHLHKNEKKLHQSQTSLISLKEASTRTLQRNQSNVSFGSKSTWIGLTGQLLSVEALVLESFALEGWSGVFAENPFLLTLCGFFCWEILFAPMPHAFHHPYQSGPLDLFADSFYSTRETLFQAHFEKLSQMSCTALLDYFCIFAQEKWNTACYLNFAKQYTLESFYPFIQFSGGHRITRLSQILLQSLNERKRGFPDLVLWKKDQVKIVEVKGPKDRLSEAQRVWIDTLLELQYPVEVIFVEAL